MPGGRYRAKPDAGAAAPAGCVKQIAQDKSGASLLVQRGRARHFIVQPHRPPRMTAARPDLYALLGVAADADGDAIRAAYRALAKLHHPDLADDATAASTDQFIRIQVLKTGVAHG